MKFLDPDCHHEVTVISIEIQCHIDGLDRIFRAWCPICKRDRKLTYRKDRKPKYVWEKLQ